MLSIFSEYFGRWRVQTERQDCRYVFTVRLIIQPTLGLVHWFREGCRYVFTVRMIIQPTLGLVHWFRQDCRYVFTVRLIIQPTLGLVHWFIIQLHLLKILIQTLQLIQLFRNKYHKTNTKYTSYNSCSTRNVQTSIRRFRSLKRPETDEACLRAWENVQRYGIHFWAV
jgi:hypothetical protein